MPVLRSSSTSRQPFAYRWESPPQMVGTSCNSRWIALMLSFMWASLPKRAMVDASCPASTTPHPPGCSRQNAVIGIVVQARVKQTKKSIKNFSDADTPERHYQFVAPSHRTAASQDQVW